MFVAYKKNIFCRLFLLFILTAHGIQQKIVCDDKRDNQRYHCIQSLLNLYQRPFTMLDIGANQGYYSLRAAQDYNAVCVMIEANDSLLEVCKTHNELNNIIFLNAHFTPNRLQHLGECEHFDVTLALNVVHTFGEQWQEAIEAMLGLSDCLIMEVGPNDTDMEEYIATKEGQIIGKIPIDNDKSTILYSIKSSNIYLRRKTWLRSIMQNNLYHIESSFIYKQLTKPASWPNGAFKTTPWIPGINLCTFKMCHGVYPTSKQLKDSLLTIKDAGHTDWLMNNMIVQGTKVALIDCDDPLCKRHFSETLLQAHQEMLDLDDPQKVEHYFWHKLIKVPISIRHTIKFFSQIFPAFSLVFDIGSSDKILIDRYLGYGAKLICCNLSSEFSDVLRTASKLENLSLIEDTFWEEKMGCDKSLDGLIARFGMPRFCNIHVPADSACAWIKTLSQPAGCIAFKFDISCKANSIACLNHLVSLGYSQFNFSSRDIPGFVLESNHYINSHKEWACSIDELLYEIDEFAKLDYNGKFLWGYVYARSF